MFGVLVKHVIVGYLNSTQVVTIHRRGRGSKVHQGPIATNVTRAAQRWCQQARDTQPLYWSELQQIVCYYAKK
jgi:prolyl-tRNA synthetase